MINNGMMTSNTDLWYTPQYLFNYLDNEFHFDIDVCALPENTKCKKYFTPEENGLLQKWMGTCWMNPPYGREIYKWVKKAYIESLTNDSTVVCLLPARTDTKWFYNYCFHSSDIRFIKGRLKFGGCKNPAPFPSMIVVFNRKTMKFNKTGLPFYIGKNNIMI